MRDIKQAFWIAGQNFYGWKKSPRIWMTFILAAILCLMLSDQIISHAIKYETILQVFEPFIWTYGDASSVMLSSLLLILLFADMPFISQATPYWLVRTKRKIWLAGQIIYVILATVIYNIFLAVMLGIMGAPFSFTGNVWSETAAMLGLWRWGEHNRSCFHKNSGKLNSLYVRSNSVWTCTFIYSFYRSSHVVFKSGCGKYGRGDRCFCSQSVWGPAAPRCFPESVSSYRKSGI